MVAWVVPYVIMTVIQLIRTTTVKRNWNDADLSENWLLFQPEWALLGNKTGPSRLGFALLLKFFQPEGQFPDSLREVPVAVVSYIAGQVGVPPPG